MVCGVSFPSSCSVTACEDDVWDSQADLSSEPRCSHPSALCAATGHCTRQVSFSPDLAAPCVSQASDSGCGLGAPCVPFDLYLCFCMAWALSQQLSKPGCSCHHWHQALMCAEHGQAGAGIPFWECTQCPSPWELCGSPALPLGLYQLLSQGFPRK